MLDSLWKLQVGAGVALLFAAVLVLVLPEILIAIVAATVAFAGMSLLGAGLRARARLRALERELGRDREGATGRGRWTVHGPGEGPLG